MLTWARLSYRQQRWELWLVSAGVALVAVGMLWFVNELTGLGAANPDCFPPDGASTSCQPILNRFYEVGGTAQNLLYAAFVAPFGMGVILARPLLPVRSRAVLPSSPGRSPVRASRGCCAGSASSRWSWSCCSASLR